MARHLNRSRSSATSVRGPLVGATLLALAGLALTGCQTGSPAAAPSTAVASASATTSPSASPTAEPSSSPTPSTAPGTGTTVIDAPADGASVQGPSVTVSGTGTAFEATLLYLVSAADGSTVDQGYTTAGANGTIGPFSIGLTLEPGTYTVKVWEPGMGEDDSSTPPLNLATVTFTVS